MSTTGERLIHVVRGLIQATEAGTARWKRTDGADTYVVSVPSGTVTVSGPHQIMGTALQQGRSLRIRDRHGNEVDSIVVPPGDSFATYFAALEGGHSPSELRELDQLLERLIELIPSSEKRAQAVAEGILRDLNAS